MAIPSALVSQLIGKASDGHFGLVCTDLGLAYLIEARSPGRMRVYRYAAGRWDHVMTMSTGGDEPCHIAINPVGTLLAVANRASRSVSVLRLDPLTGVPTGGFRCFHDGGTGSCDVGQGRPPALWVGFSQDGSCLYQVDEASDEIRVFTVKSQSQVAPPVVAYFAHTGSGPRRLLAHPLIPNRWYLVSERPGAITQLQKEGTRLDALGTVPITPMGFDGPSRASDAIINPLGDRLYVLNRGCKTVATFGLNIGGMPVLLRHAPLCDDRSSHLMLSDDEVSLFGVDEDGTVIEAFAIDRSGLPTSMVRHEASMQDLCVTKSTGRRELATSAD